MKRRVWIIGPIAWDVVLYVNEFPISGKYTPGIRTIERVGGSAANVATALATTGAEVGFLTYVGNDEIGVKLRQAINDSQIAIPVIQKVFAPSMRALILIDNTGDRTVISMSPSYLPELTLTNVDLVPEDIVVFVNWRNFYLDNLRHARTVGCFTVVGAEALSDVNVTQADLLIGSRSDIGDIEITKEMFERFTTVVLTDGAKGATAHTKNSTSHQNPFPSTVIDTTGAGDAFLSGYLAAHSFGLMNPERALEIGSRWASVAITTEASIPPPWQEIPGWRDLLVE